jgi:curved DNA-binding protein
MIDPQTGETKTFQVQIPPGVRAGQRIRLAGKGSQGMGGGSAGDLFLRVEHAADPRLRLEGHDLHTVVPVTPWEAALGTQVTVPTLGGGIAVKVPPGSSTGRKIRLRGKGFPRRDQEPGDLYAELRVEVPPELSARERELFEELAKVSQFNPRR